MRLPIAVTGADGRRALLCWAEIAPDLGQARVLLATRVDGTPLDRRGPQPVLPQDRCGARYISGITAVRVDGGYGGYGGRPAAEGDEGL
ncbi:hypothetical protein ACH5AL_04285 [Actinacidiphila glaucinigra]|uniref:hypothetical protein n=1 Tax=Actinacidiphila glaucinigra TaxID=235986 RepID=UPI00379653BA